MPERVVGKAEMEGSGHGVDLNLTHSPALKLPDGRWRPLDDIDGAMLALLALRGTQSREELIGLIWPEVVLETGRNRLRQRMHKLETLALGSIFKRCGNVGLALADGVAHDLGDHADALRLDPESRSPQLLGPFDYTSRPRLAEVIDQERTLHAARVLETLERLVFEYESCSRLAQSIACARRLCALDPTSEHAGRLLVRLHYQRGDLAAALEAVDQLQHRVSDLLGEPLSDETLVLAQQVAQARVPGAEPVVPMPIQLRHPPHTVGRDELIGQADELRQMGANIVLVGPAGAGKTRVLDDLARRWHLGAKVDLRAGDDRLPHALWRGLARALEPRLLLPSAGVPAATLPADVAELLRWLAGDPMAPPPKALAGRAVALAMTAAIDCAYAQGIERVAIDNLHYADAEGVQELCRLLDHGRMRWLIASRDLELPDPLRAWLAARTSGPDPQIDLAPLGPDAVADWLRSLQLPSIDTAAWATALCRHCGGHPHSILQVLRDLHRRGLLAQARPPSPLPVPKEVLRDIGRRLDRMDPLAQKIAFVASLAARNFSAPLAMAALTGREAGGALAARAIDLVPAWHQLEAAGILDGAAFCHDLIAQAVAGAIPVPLLPHLHRDIAAAIEDIQGPPADRAVHWLAAGDARRGGVALEEAADMALSSGLQDRARDLLEQSRAAFERAGMPREAFAVRSRTVMLTMATVSASAAERDARALVAVAANDSERAVALCALSEVLAERHAPEAVESAYRAGTLARQLEDAGLHLRARLRQAVALRATGHYAQAMAVLDELEQNACRLTPADRQLAGATRLSALDALGRREEALPLGRKALVQALAEGDYAQASVHASATGLRLGYLGCPGEALGFFESSIEYCRRADAERGWVLVDEGSIADLHADLGHFDRALAMHARVAPALRELGYTPWAHNAETSMAMTLLRLGQPGLALQQLRPLPDDSPPWLRAKQRAARARIDRVLGKPALNGLREALAALGENGAPIHPYVEQRIELEIASEIGPPASLERARACIEWALGQGHVALARQTAVVEIDALVKLGRSRSAAETGDRLEADMAGRWEAFNFYLPDLWWALVRAWHLDGQHARAAAMARRAAEWIHQVAREHVPAAFRPSFLKDNATNQKLVEYADNGLLTTDR